MKNKEINLKPRQSIKDNTLKQSSSFDKNVNKKTKKTSFHG